MQNMEFVRHVLEGRVKQVNVVHDARNKRYVLKRKGYRDVVVSEKTYRALVGLKKGDA